MIELLEKRQENSKRYKLDSRREQVVVSIGAIHYKDDYANRSEQWKDIDLTWEGNRITKAPYELTRDGEKFTIRNKRTGDISTIEALDIDIEVVPEFSMVRFVRVLKSDKASKTARFKVTGNFIVRASDEEGELPVESTLKDGILTETLKPDRPVKYPVRIDPTYQVGTGTDDAWRRLSDASWDLAAVVSPVGAHGTFWYQAGMGMRFTNIMLDQGETIASAYLVFRAKASEVGTSVLTRISAENVDDAITFADDSGAFDTRWANRDVSAIVEWDGIGAWTADVDYYLGGGHGSADPPEIKTVIQARVDSGTWVSGYDIVIFWEDFEDRSTHAIFTFRSPYSYESSPTYAPKLVITVAVGGASKSANMAAKMMAAGLI